MGAMDYYRLQNLIGDTDMRGAISKFANNKSGAGDVPPTIPRN